MRGHVWVVTRPPAAGQHAQQGARTPAQHRGRRRGKPATRATGLLPGPRRGRGQRRERCRAARPRRGRSGSAADTGGADPGALCRTKPARKHGGAWDTRVPTRLPSQVTEARHTAPLWRIHPAQGQATRVGARRLGRGRSGGGSGCEGRGPLAGGGPWWAGTPGGRGPLAGGDPWRPGPRRQPTWDRVAGGPLDHRVSGWGDSAKREAQFHTPLRRKCCCRPNPHARRLCPEPRCPRSFHVFALMTNASTAYQAGVSRAPH